MLFVRQRSELAWQTSPKLGVAETRSREVINISSHVVLRHIRYVFDSVWYSILVLDGRSGKFCFY
jgi:hypothetical protein